ncbi:MAG TPA: anti-sigma factor [Candidatus Angelobacter sp.]|nr:anti-sigma factor [Candidatus Angelobacter sp.]
MSCDDAELTLALAGMGDVDAAELREARLHAQTCARCVAAEREYALALDMIARAAVPDGPPPELRRRILESIAPQPVRPAAREEPRETATSPWWRRAWQRVPSGRAATAFGFAGSVAAVALAAVLLLTRGAAPLETLPLQAGVNQPGLAGTLTYYRSSGDAVVSLHGLAAGPRTAGGAPGVYELWLLRSGGAATAAGVLSQQPDGTWRAVVHRQAPADVTVAATLEPAPGTASPTGAQLFEASLPQT